MFPADTMAADRTADREALDEARTKFDAAEHRDAVSLAGEDERDLMHLGDPREFRQGEPPGSIVFEHRPAVVVGVVGRGIVFAELLEPADLWQQRVGDFTVRERQSERESGSAQCCLQGSDRPQTVVGQLGR